MNSWYLLAKPHRQGPSSQRMLIHHQDVRHGVDLNRICGFRIIIARPWCGQATPLPKARSIRWPMALSTTRMRAGSTATCVLTGCPAWGRDLSGEQERPTGRRRELRLFSVKKSGELPSLRVPGGACLRMGSWTYSIEGTPLPPGGYFVGASRRVEWIQGGCSGTVGRR